MSKLNVDQKTVKDLFQSKKSDFLIPDYQRPYAWGENECKTLWDDIFAFAIPDDDATKFDSNSEYFLGPIVTFKNNNEKMEVIDGQQRLTTLMLLLRAFYNYFDNMKDPASQLTKQNIEKCLWKTDEFGNPDSALLKIDSEVATDNDKDEFLEILKTGQIVNMKSRYAINFKNFQENISCFLSKYPTYFAYLPTRIMNNCILLPIEAESQDTALRIFSTLNDRGLPLSDADIFKAQFYKFYSSKGEKDKFIERWKVLEEKVIKIFHPNTGTPMDELFTRYMYCVRANLKIKSSTTEALRNFYEKHDILRKNETLENLEILAEFWTDINMQESERFSDEVMRRLYILNYAPNGMWAYFVSVYFMNNKNSNNQLADNDFCKFLDLTIAFIWAYALFRPGVNALRTPIYAEMVNIATKEPVTFSDFKFEQNNFENIFNNFGFYNIRPITRSILTWWAFQQKDQKLFPFETTLEIEHIYARGRNQMENSLKNKNNVESIGNKALLEKRINIRASDYKFNDKTKYYKGFTDGRGKKREATENVELISLSSNTDFTEKDIINRQDLILKSFVNFLRTNNLLKIM